MEKKVREITDFGSVEEVNNKLIEICKSFSYLSNKIERKSDLNAAIINIITKIQYYLKLLKGKVFECIELDSWISRNIFELLIVTKAILKDDDHLLNWMGQLFQDEIDICNNSINMANGGVSDNVKILEKRISELKELSDKHQIEPKRQFNISEISKLVGLELEYLTNYKTLSKLTHPSSYAVNASDENKNNWQMKNRIIITLQLHLGILYKSIADYYKIDDSNYRKK